ncbi:hypothetical protein L484_002772 [Morus notabilis]|uniref:Uncharacterized protein n=1 Tax=Morus notabilis TaxID=981085 RepID=W9RLM2_9ROSA|nr:hypothetical protein L484_002772 [Morus notabilis]
MGHPQKRPMKLDTSKEEQLKKRRIGESSWQVYSPVRYRFTDTSGLLSCADIAILDPHSRWPHGARFPFSNTTGLLSSSAIKILGPLPWWPYGIRFSFGKTAGILSSPDCWG